jgi:hypothetical protein
MEEGEMRPLTLSELYIKAGEARALADQEQQQRAALRYEASTAAAAWQTAYELACLVEGGHKK